MARRKRHQGSTSNSLPVFLQDRTSTTGGGLGGITHLTSGLVLEWRREGQSAWNTVTPLVTKTLGTYTSGGIVADGSVTGAYEVDFPNDAYAAGAWVALRIRGAANLLDWMEEIELDQPLRFGALDIDTSGRVTITQAFPANFANLGIQAGGQITQVLTVDELGPNALNANGLQSDIAQEVWTWTVGSGRTLSSFGFDVTVGGYAAGQAPPSASTIRDTVFNTLPSAGFVDGSFGDRWLISNNNTRELAVTGSGHIASVLHDAEPNSIPEDAFISGAISASATAADFVAEIVSGVESITVITRLGTMVESDGAGQFRFDTIALSMAPTGGGGGTGTGANTVTVTVNLSGSPVEGAKVRLTKGGESYLGTTSVSGQIVFNIDNGTWLVAITSPNTTFAGANLVVVGNQAASYNLTAISITPSAPGNVTGYWLVLGANGLPETGATISMQAVSVECGNPGLALDTTVRTASSDGSGVAQFTNLTPGVRYQAWRGTGAKVYLVIPSDASGNLELSSLLGSP